jgi:hypothetical protein
VLNAAFATFALSPTGSETGGAMRRVTSIAVVAALLLGGLAAALAWFGLPHRRRHRAAAGVDRGSLTLPLGSVGKRQGVHCKPADRGAEVNIYLRARLGFCNCTTGVADDLDRMGDLESRRGSFIPRRGPADHRCVEKGRSRAYTLTRAPPQIRKW